jgi:hypothetical protein
MPYKSSGKRVYQKKAGKWKLIKQHGTQGQAKSHATALNINVAGPESRRRKRRGK